MLKNDIVNRGVPLFWAFYTRKSDDPTGYLYAVRHRDWKLIIDEQMQMPLLYNLSTDPYEVREVSGDNPEVVNELKAFISKMAASISQDPLRPEHDPQSKE